MTAVCPVTKKLNDWHPLKIIKLFSACQFVL
uniref:Uncharacterized protein n=1 Tax=Romanomermis culicivorax TaxID=13658 RepID=A0A915I5E5_ROMCU